MIQTNIRHSLSLKTLIALAILIVSAVYISFSYDYACKDLQNKYHLLFLQEKKEITTAVQQLYKFLNLTEIRLINSIEHKERIPSILSLKIEHFTKQKVPEILDLKFIAASDPLVAYSRLGKTRLSERIFFKKNKNAASYVGKGEFQLEKSLYDDKQRIVGSLKATFSLRHLLYKHFSEDEIMISSANKQISKKHDLSFGVAELPYTFYLQFPSLSFSQFLFEKKIQILMILIFNTVSLMLGMYIISTLIQKRIRQYRLVTQNLKTKLKENDEQKKKQENTILFQKSLLRLKDSSKKEMTLLYADLQARYRQMAAQTHAINLLTSKLILETTGNEKLIKEIHSVSQESGTILRRLIDGYPMRGIEENIDIVSCIEDVKALFLPEITEKNAKIEIKGKIKSLRNIDKMIFKIILHNIFHMVVSRLVKENSVKIDLRDSDPLQISFYDDGYDVESKLSQINNSTDSGDILHLGKQRLKEFATLLGWEISFQTEREFLNSIILSIPLQIQERVLPDNVVNLFDFKPHAK